MKRSSRTCALLLGLCGALLSSSAYSQTPGAGAKDPVALYAKGKAAIEKGEFEAALASLEPSYEALPSPNTLLLVAHAKRGLGKKTSAIRDYEHVAADADLKVKSGEARYGATLQEARKWLETLSGELGHVSVKIAHAPENAEVKINNEVVKAERQGDSLLVAGYWVEPGPVVARVEAGGKSKETKADVTAGSKPTLSLDWVEGQALPPPKPVTTPVNNGETSSGIPLGVWIAGGVGVTGLALFGVFGAMAKSDYNDLQDCSPHCAESERSTADSGKTKQTVANTALVVGALGLATAGGILLFRPKKNPSQQPSVGLGVGPTSLSLHGRF